MSNLVMQRFPFACPRGSYRGAAANLCYLLRHKLIRGRKVNPETSLARIWGRARDLCVSQLFH